MGPCADTTSAAATTRASTISPRPTSTSDAVQPSWQNEKGSNGRPSLHVACSTSCRQPENYQSDAPEPPLFYPARCLKNPDDGHMAASSMRCARSANAGGGLKLRVGAGQPSSGSASKSATS